MKIDQKDRKIISLYSKNPSVSQEEVAREVGLKQPSVAVRVRKLRQMGAIVSQVGIDPLRMGLYLAKVDVASNDPSTIIKMFKNCPYFANGFSISGKDNLSLFFVSEDIATLESIVNVHIRGHGSVSEVNFNIVINSEKDFIIPTVLTPDRTDKPPCGVLKSCKDCAVFHEKKCLGCPAIGQYRGWLY